MKKLLFIVAATLLLLSCGNCQRAAKGPQRLTLMTYNVGAFSKYMEDSTPGVAALIKEYGAAIVALNETDSCNTRHNTFQVKDLAQELGADWNFHFARAIAYKNGAYGNGVVCKAPIWKTDRIALPKGEGAEARSVAVVETAGYVLGAVHLDHRSETAALAQMKYVNEWFNAVYKGAKKPVFLCGDFNVVPDSDVIAEAKTCWTLLSGTANTHSTKTPKHCIDYIFSFNEAAPVTVESRQVITDGTVELSDHFPVVITVTF